MNRLPADPDNLQQLREKRDLNSAVEKNRNGTTRIRNFVKLKVIKISIKK